MTKRLPILAIPEQSHVPFVRDDVIHIRCWCSTLYTKRVHHQIYFARLLPFVCVPRPIAVCLFAAGLGFYWSVMLFAKPAAGRLIVAGRNLAKSDNLSCHSTTSVAFPVNFSHLLMIALKKRGDKKAAVLAAPVVCLSKLNI